MAEPKSHKYWIFQATPDRFDLTRNIIPQKKDRWLANQNFKLMKKGDVVYFWQSGEQRGIYGWGIIDSDTYYVSKADGKKSIDVTYKAKMSTPILVENLETIDAMKSHRLLAPLGDSTGVICGLL